MVGAHATKPYVLRLRISLRYTSALVIHRPTRRCAASASSQERDIKKTLAENRESPNSAQVAYKIGILLADRLAPKNVSRLHLDLEKESLKHQRETKRFQALISGILEKDEVFFLGVQSYMRKPEREASQPSYVFDYLYTEQNQ